jgi:hypothetical protein
MILLVVKGDNACNDMLLVAQWIDNTRQEEEEERVFG